LSGDVLPRNKWIYRGSVPAGLLGLNGDKRFYELDEFQAGVCDSYFAGLPVPEVMYFTDEQLANLDFVEPKPVVYVNDCLPVHFESVGFIPHSVDFWGSCVSVHLKSLDEPVEVPFAGLPVVVSSVLPREVVYNGYEPLVCSVCGLALDNLDWVSDDSVGLKPTHKKCLGVK
jgi:hypothetical protein